MKQIQLSKYVTFLERPQDMIAYHNQIGEVCSIDSGIYHILSNLNNPIAFSEYSDLKENLHTDVKVENVREIVEEFLEKGFLITNGIDTDYVELKTKERLVSLVSGGQIKTIQLIVSNNCNFKCKYCFEQSIYSSEERVQSQSDSSNKIMTCEDGVKYINIVLDLVKKAGNQDLHIQFFGGEPLTNKDTIKGVLDYFGDGTRYGINLSYSIVTNGSLIDYEIAEYFNKYSVGVVVSFDSPKKTDRNMHSGKDSRHQIYEALQKLKATNNYVAFNSVLSDCTYEYFDTAIIDCALEYGVWEVGVVLDLSPDFYNRPISEIADKLIELCRYAKSRNIRVSGYWMSTYLSMFEHLEFDKGFKTCSGTGSQLSIEPNGSIFACKGSSRYYGKIENLNRLFLDDTYKHYAKRSIRNSSKCNACNLEGFCSGFCLGPLEQQYSDVSYLVENYCELMKTIVERLLLEEGEIDKYEL
jgi:uncharacterized protein